MSIQWGKPPAPLLPKPLREAWAQVVLPTWLCSELNIAKQSTCAALSENIWQYVEAASERALNSITTLFRSKLEETTQLPCVRADSWPPSVSLTESALSTRSKNALRLVGLLERPRDLAALTFADLLKIPGLGFRSALEIACLLECALAAQTVVVNQLPLFRPTGTNEWIDKLLAAGIEVWSDQISNGDPRFSDLLSGQFGTLQERIEHCLAEPTSMRAVAEGQHLAGILPQICERIWTIDSLKLEEGLGHLLGAATRDRPNSHKALMARFGWDGKAPRTLDESGRAAGITRERVRQIESKFCRKIAGSYLYMPQLDRALIALEDAAPINVVHAETLLISSTICSKTFSIDSIIATARLLGRQTDIRIIELAKDRVVASSKTSGETRLITKAGRRLAGMAGVASVFQVENELSARGATSSADAVRNTLKGLRNVEFLTEDWFWITDIPVGRNRLSNVTKKILSVASPQAVSSIREGVRRAFTYRAKSNARYESLAAPPVGVLAAFFSHSPEYRVAGNLVAPVQAVDYRNELGEVDQAFVDILRGSPAGVLDRKSIMEACCAKGLNENSVSLFLTYSPIMEHAGLDAWKLRGVHVDPAAIEALREANMMAPREKRVLNFGWRTDGRLWIAARLPYTTSNFVMAVPGSFRRFLTNRSFQARDSTSRHSCGQISVTETGTSFGYSPFLRIAGADAGDVILAEFDLAKEEVHLCLTDDLALDSEG